jgi:hypothetical protein
MADIIDMIQAGRSQIRRGQDQFRELSQQGSDPRFRQERADTWDTLADMIGLHIRTASCVTCAKPAARRAGQSCR